MTEIKKKRLSINFAEKHVPWLLLFFTLLAHLPLVKGLGFYWDDWPMLWFKVTQNAEGFAQAFTSDRPFLGHLYEATATFLGTDPLQWQITTVILRWAVSLAFWWTLRQIWPNKKKEVFWIAVFVSVFPGFKQMPIVYVWANALIMLLAYILSYGMMLKAIASGNWKAYLAWTVPSVLLYTFTTISTEYYTGLDVSRGLFIWLFLCQSAAFCQLPFKKRLLKTFLHWLPYLAVLGAFMFWRVFIFQFPGYKPVLLTQLQTKPLHAIYGVICRIIEDAYLATWGAWTEFFRFPNHLDYTTISGQLFWLVVAIALAAGLLIAFNYASKENSDDEKGRLRWGWTALILGLLMVIFPGFPYWVTSLPIKLEYPYDRFLIAFMFGSSIFMTGLVELVLRTRIQRNIVFCLFAAMAVGGNILNANNYRKDWQMQKDFADQLVTRIPELAQPAMLITESNPMVYESDNSLTGLVNLALAPDHNNLLIPYGVNIFSLRFDSVDQFLSEPAIYEDFRSALFSIRPDQAIVYFYSPPGCLRILDPEQHSTLPIFPESYYEIMKLSHPMELINPNGTGSSFLQDEVFKRPVEQNWCYYFEKADLARQTGDWQKIAEIGDEAMSKFEAGEASEYIPFVEAYAYTGRWEDAITTFQKIHKMDKSLDGALCPILQNLFFYTAKDNWENISMIQQGINSIGCIAFTE